MDGYDHKDEKLLGIIRISKTVLSYFTCSNRGSLIEDYKMRTFQSVSHQGTQLDTLREYVRSYQILIRIP